MRYFYFILSIFLLLSLKIWGQASAEISTNAVVFPRYTNNTRPSGAIPIGATIFNVTQNTHQYYTGSNWTNLAQSGGGASPWLINGSNVYLNNNNKVGINTDTPVTTLDVIGENIRLSRDYYLNPAPASNTYTMQANVDPNGSIPSIYDLNARILDPSGTGNTQSGMSLSSIIEIGIYAGDGRTTYGINFNFENLDIGDINSDPYFTNRIVFSTSSDINNADGKILTINRFNASQYLGRTFFLAGNRIFLHFIKESGVVSGFQLLYQGVFSSNPSSFQDFYTESISSGLVYHSGRNSFAVGEVSRAAGNSSTAIGSGAKAYGDNSMAIGQQSKAIGTGSIALGSFSSAGGNGNIAIGGSTLGFNSIAIGSSATAYNNNSMALSGYYVSTNSAYQLATGFRSYRFYTKDDKSTFVQLNEGQGSWSGTSDSTKKERFRPVNGEDILRKISKLKLTSWNFKNSTERHYGPMAQDFFAAFGRDELGIIGNDTTINSGDFDGINLIAIHALEKRTKVIESENTKLKVELAELKQALANSNKNQALLLEHFKDLQALLTNKPKEQKNIEENQK
ncbi:tail fiber domain-containing protein [Emticicia soli]|uniref:Tail fiber domain-containing protein n=1 Tax=Emticicia soli TaxID=2027878 RepID=A0ABW5JAF8_9BACT